MYPTSSSSHSSQTFHNELKGRYGNGEERYLTEYPKHSHSSSAIFSSPAMHSRSRPSHRPSPSRSASHQHSRSLQYSPPNFDYSHGSYDRRSSSPLTSASSPPPMTSPLIAPIRMHANYEPKVRIVGRDREESYHFCDSEYDSDFSRFSRRNDEDNWRPSLPSFKSLFGSGEHHKDPSPKITLSPLNFPLPPIRAQHRRAVSSVHALAGVEACAATNLSDAADPQCLQLHVQQSRANDRAVLSDPDHTIHSGEQQCQSNPAFPAYPVKISHQAPHRQKLLFSDADPTPDTPEERGTKFLSPVKGSPYPRRTYFLVSSERGRRSPEPNTTRCGLYQLAEIAEKARSDLPECTALEVVPEPTEESIIYSASSPFSSPVGYQSSLPPSSPPTSEAQLSPMLPEKELSEPTTLPLADVKNLTFSASDRIEPSKPIVAATSHLGDNGEKDTQEMKSPMTVVLIQDLNSNVVNNESPSHGLSTVTLYGNIDADMESKQTLDMVESGEQYHFWFIPQLTITVFSTRIAAVAISQLR
ncbi:hypothetical protein BT96DRAFT_469201 [Gymnopus androsaceus JB14]|uniref:Uncharacterized protein n=1 Tax=Gymnopus androsaceus JB14 TaxID=1447944 RepID=A0A6A4IP68_9AGAR|nr:hypothetical protein BT96DRAFT_469201 [Gymnopus androsaceus JB14]